MPSITLIVNGAEHKTECVSGESLLSVLRNRLGLTGTKYGCGEGQCGACTVLLRGKATRSCRTPAESVAGQKIVTIEGLSKNNDHPLQLAWNEPEMARVSQKDFLRQWAAEQFPSTLGLRIATLWDEAYRLNFVRKPELMGFNGYDDDVKRTEFNPLAWGDQNRTRLEQWNRLNEEAESLKRAMPENYRNVFFELVYYPVEAAAEQNAKFLWADRSYRDAGQDKKNAVGHDAVKARAAYDRIQALTRTYNSLDGGKWDGMMSAHPRERHVFDMPATAGADMAKAPLPKAWRKGGGALRCDGAKGIREWNKTVSVNATHFTRKQDDNGAMWRVLPELGVDGGSMVLGRPGLMKSAGWVGAAIPSFGRKPCAGRCVRAAVAI